MLVLLHSKWDWVELFHFKVIRKNERALNNVVDFIANHYFLLVRTFSFSLYWLIINELKRFRDKKKTQKKITRSSLYKYVLVKRDLELFHSAAANSKNSNNNATTLLQKSYD